MLRTSLLVDLDQRYSQPTRKYDYLYGMVSVLIFEGFCFYTAVRFQVSNKWRQ